MFKIKQKKLFFYILNIVFVSLIVQNLTVNLYAGNYEEVAGNDYNNGFSSDEDDFHGYRVAQVQRLAQVQPDFESDSDYEGLNSDIEEPLELTSDSEETDDEGDFDQKLYSEKDKKRLKNNKKKQQKALRKKQMLCIFFCILIVGGAILVPSLVPFFYIFKGSSSPLLVDDAIFDMTRTPPNQSEAFASSLASLRELQPDNYNHVCSDMGGQIMCCGVENNSILKCCVGNTCKTIEFNSSPKNSYQIDKNGMAIALTAQDRIVNKFVSFSEHTSYEAYSALNDLGYYCKNGEAPTDVIDKVHSKIFEMMEELSAKMPNLQKCEKIFSFICSDHSKIYINKHPSIIEKLLKNTFVGDLFAVVPSRIFAGEINPEKCIIFVGTDFKKLRKMALSDSDIKSILAHEFGHVLQEANANEYFLQSAAQFESYLSQNKEIEADLVSQLSLEDFPKNSGGLVSAHTAFHLNSLEGYYNKKIIINEKFNCFEQTKTLHYHHPDLLLHNHPLYLCRLAFVLSLAEAQEKMRDLLQGVSE